MKIQISSRERASVENVNGKVVTILHYTVKSCTCSSVGTKSNQVDDLASY